MKRWEAWSVHLSTLLVGGTGLVYAWMRYALAPADPFAVVNHPLQADVQHWHIVTAPLLVFAAGLIWRDHVWKHWRSGIESARRSGLSMLVTLAPMVVSGYLIQTAVAEGWRLAWVIVHCTTAGLWLAAYGVHAVIAVRRWQRKGKTRRAGASPAPTQGEVTPAR